MRCIHGHHTHTHAHINTPHTDNPHLTSPSHPDLPPPVAPLPLTMFFKKMFSKKTSRSRRLSVEEKKDDIDKYSAFMENFVRICASKGLDEVSHRSSYNPSTRRREDRGRRHIHTGCLCCPPPPPQHGQIGGEQGIVVCEMWTPPPPTHTRHTRNTTHTPRTQYNPPPPLAPLSRPRSTSTRSRTSSWRTRTANRQCMHSSLPSRWWQSA